MTRAVRIASGQVGLAAMLYGELPARRAALLCHGAKWDASGWAAVAPRFVERGVPALALNFRGYDGSSGKTTRTSVVEDVREAVAWLRTSGASEVGLVGASMGGHAVLAAAASVAPECVVAISAPVRTIPAAEARAVRGRKLFVCAERDWAAAAVRRAYDDAEEPKSLRLFPGREHSRGMFSAPYAPELLALVLEFVAVAE